MSDTHIPDRARNLPPALLKGLHANEVDLILHAGDISIPRVLDELGEIAPVIAVKGNRDLLFGEELPLVRMLEINGFAVMLTHGHMGLVSYWLDKFQHLVSGYRSDRYINRLINAAPNATVYIFGHSHKSEDIHVGEKLFFNPGSATFSMPPETRKSWGMLTFSESGFASTINFFE